VIDDVCDDRLGLQPYLRPLGGALALRAMKELAHGEPIAWERPLGARPVIGFPSRRSEPGRLHLVILVSTSW